MTNTLEKIIADKKNSIEKYKKSFTIEDLKKKISSYKNYLNFKDKLKKNEISVIAEIIKASPSAGIMLEDYEPKLIAKQYLNSGASCLSVLTEENYFKGKLEHIDEVKKEYGLDMVDLDSIQGYDAAILAVGHEAYTNFTTDDWQRMLTEEGVVIDVKSLYDKDTFSGTSIKHWRL